MRTSRRPIRVGACALLSTLALAACSGGSGDDSSGTAASGVAPGSGPCVAAAAKGGVGAKALLACLRSSLAYIETPAGTGSGILVGDGYVVTNAHVVDPFGSVTVTFDGGESHESVPVKGADLFADIAIVGPVETSRAAVAIEDYEGVEQGDDVFLVGYPGETDAERPEPAISKGILSRVREAKPFGLTYLQTDAAIGGGQSGGALVDGRGRVIGVSGMTFAEEFALALGGSDVRKAIGAVRAGTATPYRSLPEGGAVSTGSVHVVDPFVDEGLLLLPRSEKASSVQLTLSGTPRPVLVVLDMITGEPTFVSQSAIELSAELTGQKANADAAVPKGAREVRPGLFEVDIPASTYLLAVFGAASGPADVAFDASVPVQVLADLDQDRRVAVGDEIDAVMDYLEESDTYLLDLAAGDQVTIFVGSPTGDMAYSVRAPGQKLADVQLVDDSDIGLSGLDAKETYTATVSGTHVIRVIGDGMSSGYRVSVTKG